VALPVDGPIAAPDNEATWAWPDGLLHPEPPPAVARMHFTDLNDFFRFGFFVPVEAPPCGAVKVFEPADTNDGQCRRFTCDRPAGHPPEGQFEHDPHVHRMVLSEGVGEDGGRSFTWRVAEEVPSG
jgi:hypothetical protein